MKATIARCCNKNIYNDVVSQKKIQRGKKKIKHNRIITWKIAFTFK